MTIEELNKCILKGHLMASSEIYKKLEIIDVILGNTYQLTTEQINFVHASKLFLEYQLNLRGGNNG
tara:strand:+ start:2317 stop:2514 length:198 start_codon:yes stop_codon:yes gene_type:complete